MRFTLVPWSLGQQLAAAAPAVAGVFLWAAYGLVMSD